MRALKDYPEILSIPIPIQSQCLKTVFVGMGICLSLRGLCSAKSIPVPRFLGLFEVEPVYKIQVTEKNVMANEKKTLNHANYKLQLCFMRLLIKKSQISNRSL